MKILTVCGMGSGSSLILKINVDEILNKNGVSAEVEACDLGSVGGNNADLIISTQELKNQLAEHDEIDQIFVNNVVDKQAIEEIVMGYFNQK